MQDKQLKEFMEDEGEHETTLLSSSPLRKAELDCV